MIIEGGSENYFVRPFDFVTPLRELSLKYADNIGIFTGEGSP